MKIKVYSRYEDKLVNHCYQALAKIEQVKFIVEGTPDIGVIAFTVTDHHNHDIATSLDTLGIAIRSGHHCAMPLMEYLKVDGCLRVSLAAYNTIAEIDYLIECLKNVLLDDGLVGNNPKAEIILTPQSQELENIIALFSKTKGWDSRHREIMLLGKKLLRLDKTLRDDKTLISGCESHAWLKAEQSNQGLYTFTADSDAKIIRGLLMIVLTALNNKTAQQIRAFNIDEYFTKLGLLQHLSPSRGNGLLAIVEKIKILAK